jgi:hypothetical protein
VSYSSEVLADSPVIWLKLDEASGGFADSGSDGTGFSDLATSTQQSPLVADGLYSAASSGSGIGLRSSVPAPLAGSNVTQEVWVDIPSGDQKGTFTHLGTGSAGWGFGIGNGSVTSIAGRKLTVLIAGVAFYDSGHTFTDGIHHIVMTHTTGSNFVIYVDGSQVFSGTFGTPPSAGAGVGVGVLPDAGSYELSSGIKVDHPAFYASALSGARVSAHYLAGSGLNLAGSLPGLTSAISLDAAPVISLAAEIPGLTSVINLDGDVGAELSLSSSIPGLTSALSLNTASTVTLAASLPGLTSALNLAKPPETDRRNRVGGRQRRGTGVATWEPAVVAPPASVAPVHNYDKARAFTVPTIGSQGRPIYTATEIEAKRHRIRIIVGGKDVSFFRDVATPPPSYRLVEPLDYGAGTLELPQISPAFETLGVGALKWLKKGKRVIVQRVNVDTGAVVATDYRGFISDFNVSGNSLTCELGGIVSGQAALMDRQPPIFRTVKDIGRWMYGAIERSSRVQFAPRFGPTTGIRIASRGGSSYLDYINELTALSVHTNGAQWTVGRRANGTWGIWLKDTTTIDATIYLDDSRMVADLHQSIAEEPNRIYVTGINPDGQRVKFGGYPGLRQGPPAPYPFDNTATTFGQGTTNEDCDHPEDRPINAMTSHLTIMRYLTPEANEYVYNAAATRAIKRLQDDAGLAETGVMNLATWKALWDISATGYSLWSSTILPAAQRTSVKPWHLSGSGAKMTRNTNYQTHKVVVDRSINVGAGFTRQQMREWARDELREATTPNWVGTVTCHLSAIEGEHNPGDPLTDDMLMPISAIKPGMNVWLPTFDGGTLVHVSGKEVPGSGPQVLTVDTRRRDTMAAWEAIARNRESRNRPARAWYNDHRQSGVTKDAFVEWDEIGGTIDDSVHLEGDTWNVFPVLAGQGGTVQRIRIALDSDVRFSVSVTARSIRAARMNHLVPAPLTEAGSARWDKQWVRNALDDRGWVYQAGRFEQRCGYWPGVETGDDGEPSGDPINGQWEDDTGFGYHTFAEPVLYVAIWPEADCRLRAGRIMWNQLEAGA